MTTVTLYKYKRADGGITVSPIGPDCEYTTALRLIADEGKALTQDDVNFTTCVDVSNTDGWYEVDAPEESELYENTDI